jgi:hypothetical protein
MPPHGSFASFEPEDWRALDKLRTDRNQEAERLLGYTVTREAGTTSS